jgi:hypothetical protein
MAMAVGQYAKVAAVACSTQAAATDTAAIGSNPSTDDGVQHPPWHMLCMVVVTADQQVDAECA